jgi:membrane-associated phospholipid phosphatase
VIAGALAAGILFFSRRLGFLAAVLALTVAFARVYAGVHYPGDVVGGLILGTLVATVLSLLLRRPVLSLVDRLAATPLRPLLISTGPSRPSRSRLT